MTSPAMAQPEGEVGAAIPFLALACDRLKPAGSEEQNFPALLEQANIEREGDRVRRRCCSDRIECVKFCKRRSWGGLGYAALRR